jgi:hypothetical protein
MFWKNRINRLLSYDASLDVVKLTGGWFTPTWNRQSGPFSENNSEGLASANKDGQWGTSTAQEASSSRFNSNTWGSSIKGWQI